MVPQSIILRYFSCWFAQGWHRLLKWIYWQKQWGNEAKIIICACDKGKPDRLIKNTSPHLTPEKTSHQHIALRELISKVTGNVGRTRLGQNLNQKLGGNRCNGITILFQIKWQPCYENKILVMLQSLENKDMTCLLKSMVCIMPLSKFHYTT